MDYKHLRMLAAKLTSDPAWVWRAGMSTICGKVNGILLEDSLESDDSSELFWIAYFSGCTRDGGGLRDEIVPTGAIPDLSDPATIGCLIGMVRKAYGNKDLFAGRDLRNNRWIVWDGEGDPVGYGESEVDAIASAFLGRSK